MSSGSDQDPPREEEEGIRPTNPVDHVPETAVSSETTPPDEPHAERVSGTGVPGVSPDPSESLPPGRTGSVDDPLHAMEPGMRARRLLRRLRGLFSPGGPRS